MIAAKAMKDWKKSWTAYLALCAVVLLSGCAAGPTAGTHARSAATAPLPTPTVSLSPLTAQQAWGQVQISQFSLDLGALRFVPTAENDGVTDDGQVCGWTVPMRSADGPTYTGSVGLIDLHTGHITLLTTLQTGYGPAYCTVTGPWVIWMQTATHPVGDPTTYWSLRAFNRQTGEVRLLDQARTPDASHPYASIQPEPDASNGRVVWITYSDNSMGATQSEMYTFATGTKTVLADRTDFPRISWPWVSWGDGHASAIVFENLVTKQQVQLPMTYAPTTAAFSGTSFVYTNSDYSQVTLVPSILQPTVSAVIADKSTDGSYFKEFPTLNDRLVAWVGPYGWLVFDRKLQRPVKIAIGVAGLNGFISSHYLVGTPALTQADYDAGRSGLPFHPVMIVLDTNTLP